MNTFLIEQFPFDTLEKFGLSRPMIEDLPETVLDTILAGGRSPLLPIKIKTRYGFVCSQAKFKLAEETEDSQIDVLFYPLLKEAPISAFSPEEQEALLAGKVILTDMVVPDEDQSDVHLEKSYVQLDKDTNHIFYVHSPVIVSNVRSADNDFQLSTEQVEKILNGEIITIDAPYHLSIGINLFTETGVFICPGDAKDWKRVLGERMPKYSFGVEGCWVNDKGTLHYVKEDDFDLDILEARAELAKKNERKASAPHDEESAQEEALEEERLNAQQMTR